MDLEDVVKPIELLSPSKVEDVVNTKVRCIQEGIRKLENLPPFFENLYFNVVSSLNPQNFSYETGERLNPQVLFEGNYFNHNGIIGWFTTNKEGKSKRLIDSKTTITSHESFGRRPLKLIPRFPVKLKNFFEQSDYLSLDNSYNQIGGLPRGDNLFGQINKNSNFTIQLYKEGILKFSENEKQIFANFIKELNFEFDNIRTGKVDRLTGLVNQNMYKELFLHSIKDAISMGEEYSIAMFDIDNFKKFNDEYGHQTGDLVLEKLGYILNKSVRENDIAARYGGEETILLVRGGTMAAQTIVKRITDELNSKPFYTSGGLSIDEVITLSGGIYSTEMNHINDEAKQNISSTLDMQIERADISLYEAKNSGRNKVFLYRES